MSSSINCCEVLYSWRLIAEAADNILCTMELVNPLKPNDPYRGCTAPLTSKRCILYIYSTNIGTEYFKHGIYSPFFFSSKCSLFHNSNVLVPVLFTFYIQCLLKLKKNNSVAKRLVSLFLMQNKYCNEKRREKRIIFTILSSKLKVLESLLFTN